MTRPDGRPTEFRFITGSLRRQFDSTREAAHIARDAP